MEAEYPFHTAFLLTLLAVASVRMYFSGYADAMSGERQTTKGEGAFRLIRLVLVIPLLIAFLAYMVWPPSMAWSQFELAPSLRWLGIPFAILGVALLIWVQRHLSKNFSGTVMIRAGGNVVTTGPYTYVRHPMYWSFLLIGAAITLLSANWLLGGGFYLVILIVMFLRTPVEEKALLDAYGDEYAEYMKRTGKFFPKFYYLKSGTCRT